MRRQYFYISRRGSLRVQCCVTTTTQYYVIDARCCAISAQCYYECYVVHSQYYLSSTQCSLCYTFTVGLSLNTSVVDSAP